MITITTQGKTYQIVDLKGRIKSTIEEWIRSWFLEEVKENKDSILEKLRNGLEKRKQKMIEENWWPSCIEQVVWTLAVLDSLETKEEPVPPTDKWREQYIADHPDELSQLQTFASPDKFKAMREQPQFTPWQMIEVSNDGEKWEQEPRKFVKNNPTWWYEVEYKWLTSMTDYFEYARPLQPQEDIELPWVPDWKAFTNDGRTYDSKDYQIEQLTKFCQAIAPIVNQLIKANKK